MIVGRARPHRQGPRPGGVPGAALALGLLLAGCGPGGDGAPPPHPGAAASGTAPTGAAGAEPAGPPPLRDVPPPETVELLPFRASTSWRLGEAYAAGFTWLAELAGHDVVGVTVRSTGYRGPAGGGAAPPEGRGRTPAERGAGGPPPPWTADEVAGARRAADHVIAGGFEREGNGLLRITLWRCPRGEPRGCDRFVETTPERDPYATLARLMERAFGAAGGRVPGECRSSWERGVTRDPYAFLWLGRAALPYLAGGDAETAVRRALLIDPRMAEARLLWARVLRSRGEEARQDPLDALARADLLRAGFTAARREMASIHLDRGEGARALAVLSGLAGLRPDDPVLLRERAELALSLGRPDEAARALDEAPEAIQGTVPVGRLRARIAQELERPAEAERWLARVAAAAPDDAEARLDLGSLARRRGAPGEAEGWYWEALAVGAGPDARVGLMQLMADQGRYPEALALNREIAAQRPGEARWARWEAWLLLASGESDRAAAAYTALSRASPGDPEARLGRCRALLAAKEARAVDACREAARSPGADARAWVALGEALHAQGRSGEAREAATKAVALDPDLPDGYRLLERSLPEGSAEAKLAAARARTRGE